MSSSSSATVVVVVHRPTPTPMLYPSINNSVGGISLMRNNNNNNNRLRLSSKRQQSERKIRGYYNWTVVACSGSNSSSELDCVGTGLDVECIVVEEEETRRRRPKLVEEEEEEEEEEVEDVDVLRLLWDWGLLLSPFFFWGTSMVAMKEVLPKAGPFFVSSFRLIPAGILLIAFASYKGRRLPSGFMAWFSISLFALVDSTCFQGFLAQGLQTTSAGLGSLIIDSQPLTVALLASFFYGESIGPLRASGLLLGLIGLLLLQLPPALDLSFQAPPSLWGTGEWWMLLAAQSMALGTVMVRWVSKYSDPVMATGWHMLIGALPFLFISLLDHNNNHTNPALALLCSS
ncbi:hypothetical protein Sjap_014417 [Stephania japonica]|uniref:EamA domain-containing protein n=1 Tax=Stephania japonica TaxID=461633 RepID=A0AAP0IHY0_9MAGN